MATVAGEHEHEKESARVSVGRQFYSWSTLGTFGGSVWAVTMLGQVGKSLGFNVDANNWFPFLMSIAVVTMIAFATEPVHQGGIAKHKMSTIQKSVQTFFNSLFVYAAVIGLPSALGAGE